MADVVGTIHFHFDKRGGAAKTDRTEHEESVLSESLRNRTLKVADEIRSALQPDIQPDQSLTIVFPRSFKVRVDHGQAGHAYPAKPDLEEC